MATLKHFLLGNLLIFALFNAQAGVAGPLIHAIYFIGPSTVPVTDPVHFEMEMSSALPLQQLTVGLLDPATGTSLYQLLVPIPPLGPIFDNQH